MKYIFETRMEVRDYECDIEGIVNNANYLHYAEHTRHLFLKSLGVSFAALHEPEERWSQIPLLSGYLPCQRRNTLFPCYRGTRLSHQRSLRQQP